MALLSAKSYQLKARVIGIDASRAFLKRRTGIEEYSYQVIKHLRDTLSSDAQIVLYVRKKFSFVEGRLQMSIPEIDFELPRNWTVRALWAPRFWTQLALSLEMLWRAPDVLFVPAHTVPIIHPKKTVVTIHGLEYEFCPGAYSLWERIYMHYSIKFSCRVASTVICVSENTKRDVMALYRVAEEKIAVISEGYEQTRSMNQEAGNMSEKKKPYLLFIGRLEERKNIVRIVEAFELLKEKYQIPHKLVLVGKAGFRYERIRDYIQHSAFNIHIRELGYVTEEEKWELLRNADVFLFPTLYEGFGIPVLEAQSVRVPVVTSNTSSLPEVAGEGAVLVDPTSVESIAEGVQRLLSDQGLRSGIIEKATHNVSRYSWARCAREVGRLLRRQ
ncbi:MAG: glycosyltransferase family 1 protein [Candidatus Moraniibacteriota bacterium]|nr:MAG: glycosyltransferase family 1 protein [Candidatus Moranbacteria bacterium]